MRTSSSAAGLLQQLRTRLSDDSYTRPAFTLYLRDSAATDATIEVRHGRLTSTIINSNRRSDLNLDLSDFQYDTVGRLVEQLSGQEGPFRSYEVVADNQLDGDHPSSDLKPIGFGDLLEGGVRFGHRRFSDSELRQFLSQAVNRHNISYTIDTVPENEYIFVLQLAHSEALRVLATNAVKRRGLEQTVSDLIDLADSYEQSYSRDVKRQARPIPVAKIRDNSTERGDVVLGKMYRRSSRTGFEAPLGVQPPPDPPILREPLDEDVTDSTIRLTWEQAKDYDFYQYELWRDTDEQNLRRLRAGNILRRPTTGPGSIVDIESITSSKLVFQSFGANSNFDTVAFATFIEEFGQLINSFVDGDAKPNRVTSASPGGLEPETTYHYRLFVVDLNYKTVSSLTVRAKTKAHRARAIRPSPISPVSGPATGGTTVTITRDTRFGPFDESVRVKLGDKFVENLTVVDPDTLTFTTPAISNPDNVGNAFDLVIYNKDGQRDVHTEVWTYSS